MVVVVVVVLKVAVIAVAVVVVVVGVVEEVLLVPRPRLMWQCTYSRKYQ